MSKDTIYSSGTEAAVCIGCRSESVDRILDFGRQPPSNRFFHPGDPQSDGHDLALGCCVECGLVQLIRPMPAEMVRARHAWLSYNEPEGHLDEVTDDLIRECQLGVDARILGFSHLDDTTLLRFNQRGFANTHRLDSRTDLGIDISLAGLETLQQAMTAERAARLASQHGLADLLVVRRVLEHAHEPLKILRALAQLVKPNGQIVFEVPESTKFMASRDYSFVWEEHITYFTARTLHRLLQEANLDVSMSRVYEYPLEDSLIALGRPGSAAATGSVPPKAEIELAANFGASFMGARERVHSDLSRLQNEGKRVAVFGAGHLAVKFLNLFGLKGLVHCVIDDKPEKLGLCLPGSGLPVLPSTALIDENIDLCLLSMSPESEKKVMSAKHEYAARGGRFGSIFPSSPMAFWRAMS
jgi:hypothetical protein